MNDINRIIPQKFRYMDVFLKGKPKHDGLDAFCVRHPSMNVSRRAKIFSPFDALKGFNEAVSLKNILYCDRMELSDEDKKELDRRLNILYGLTYNGRVARENNVRVTAVYYSLCNDENSEAFGIMGRYESITGICKNVDRIYENILIDTVRISFDDIYSISNADGLFQKDWSEDFIY